MAYDFELLDVAIDGRIATVTINNPPVNVISMALLADGLHMASHAAALGISVAAYVYARRHASDRRFSFGTGKVNSLAAFASAMPCAPIPADECYA